jgi:hypothetical protein
MAHSHVRPGVEGGGSRGIGGDEQMMHPRRAPWENRHHQRDEGRRWQVRKDQDGLKPMQRVRRTRLKVEEKELVKTGQRGEISHDWCLVVVMEEGTSQGVASEIPGLCTVLVSEVEPTANGLI